MRPRANRLGPAGGSGADATALPGAGHTVRHRDERAARFLLAALYAPMPWLMRVLVAVHFRKLRVGGAAGFPARGPVIVVANHPATWTDVLVLDVALRRKLHFLAHETLFHPTPRAWILRLFGTLPVAREGPDHVARNTATFSRCTQLLARGEVIALFPEGISADDRSLRPFHTGAVRIALDRIEAGWPVPIVPVGIHYVDRTAFRADVIVRVGAPLRMNPRSIPDPAERTTWTAAMTAILQRRVSRLIEPPATPVSDRPAARAVVLAILGAPLGAMGLLVHVLPALATSWVATSHPDPTRIALARIVSGMVFFTAWYLGLVLMAALGPWTFWAGAALAAGAAALGAIALAWTDVIRSLLGGHPASSRRAGGGNS